MKQTIFYCLLIAAPILGFSQQQVKDPAKEKNDLIKLRAAMLQESALGQTSVDQEQTLLDSVSSGLTRDSIELAKIKIADPEGRKTYIKSQEKKLRQLREQRDQLTKKLNTSKATLKEASDLVKELDAEIKKLGK